MSLLIISKMLASQALMKASTVFSWLDCLSHSLSSGNLCLNASRVHLLVNSSLLTYKWEDYNQPPSVPYPSSGRLYPPWLEINKSTITETVSVLTWVLITSVHPLVGSTVWGLQVEQVESILLPSSPAVFQSLQYVEGN